jgi:ABC-2 type transport system ATP-binding protein
MQKPKYAINITDLKKTYKGGFEALKGISLQVPHGQFFGLLGPNGAGKSTIIGILTSLVNKTAGNVEIMGHDLDTDLETAKSMLGVVPQEFNFNMFEPCMQILVNQAGYYGVPRQEAIKRAEKYLAQMELTDKKNTIARNLSGGLKRRLMIARALIHEPKILILDEPTAGVDISLRRSMWDYLIELNKKGLTIILTTHYLEEAENLCENIAIINKGKIVEHGPTRDLLDKIKKETVIVYTTNDLETAPVLINGVARKIDDKTLEIDITEDISIETLVQELSGKDIHVKRFKNKANRLEELFMNMVEENK